MVATTANDMSKVVDQLCDERDSLRAELAKVKEALRLSAQGLHTYVEALNAGNTANAALKARIAALKLAVDRVEMRLCDAGTAITQFEVKAERAEARAEKAEADYVAVIVDTARELDCFADNEGILAAIATLQADYKRAEAERDALREQLRLCAEMLSVASSGYIPGSVSDNEWEESKDAIVKDAIAALNPSTADEK